MKLNLYINKNLLFDYLSRNLIAPDSVVHDRKKNRTISTKSENFLFVTHKKLNRKSREQGIAEPDFVCPITLSLSEPVETDGSAILVSKSNTDIDYTFTNLANYDSEKHIGAFLIGEIPFSRIENIYFDTQDDLAAFTRPSPDYWYPTNKFSLLPKAEFIDEFSLESVSDETLLGSSMTSDDIIKAIRSREKQRAALLSFFYGSSSWQYGNYAFSIEANIQQMLGIKDEDISLFMPHYCELRDSNPIDLVSLVGEAPAQQATINYAIYNHICETLITEDNPSQLLPDYMVKLLHTIFEKVIVDPVTAPNAKIIQKAFEEIGKLITDASDKSPEQLLASIPPELTAVKALLFITKNPCRFDLFLESLSAYHADLSTKRYALVFWGFLNGLYGVPSEEFQKDNQQLWQFIEAFVSKQEKTSPSSLAVSMPDTSIINGKVLGITLKEERLVTAEETREALLLAPIDSFSSAFYAKLLDAAGEDLGSKKKAANKGYSYSIASTSIPEVRIGDELTPVIKKVLEQLLKDCKTAQPNKEKLFADYIKDAKKFAFVFSIDPDYWRNLFLVLSEKKNA